MATETRTARKKPICLDKQNNNFARASHFFENFFAVIRRETSEFHFYGEREHKKSTPGKIAHIW